MEGFMVNILIKSKNLTYTMLNTSNGYEMLANLFMTTNNEGYDMPYDVALYGGGDHNSQERINAKMNIWGKRGDNPDEARKCYIVQYKGEDIGLVNIGVNMVNNSAGNQCSEFGVFFKYDVGKELQAEAIKSVLLGTMMENKNILGEGQSIMGTASAIEHVINHVAPEFCARNNINNDEDRIRVTETLITAQRNKNEAIEEAGLTRLAPDQQTWVSASLAANAERFTVQPDKILEGKEAREVEVFYCDYDNYDTSALGVLEMEFVDSHSMI